MKVVHGRRADHGPQSDADVPAQSPIEISGVSGTAGSAEYREGRPSLLLGFSLGPSSHPERVIKHKAGERAGGGSAVREGTAPQTQSSCLWGWTCLPPVQQKPRLESKREQLRRRIHVFEHLGVRLPGWSLRT